MKTNYYVFIFLSTLLINSQVFSQSDDCAGIIGGLAMVDDCGDCQSAYLYDFVMHTTSPALTSDVNMGPTQMLVLPNDSSNPYWNVSCVELLGCMDVTALNFNYLATEDDNSCEYALPEDCAGVIGGLAMVDDCGDCQSALIYDYLIHVVTGIALTSDVDLGPTQMLVLPDNPSNPYWNASCIITLGCTDSTAVNYSWMAIEDDGTCEYLNEQTCQNIEMNEGWSIFSTYVTTDDMDASSLFEFTNSNILIIKDYLGNTYLPEWNFNAIGNLLNTQGYQIKLYESMSVDFCGTYSLPEATPIQLPGGWFSLGYLRIEPSPIDAVVNDFVDNIIIIKDYLGSAYLPSLEFNGIGEMLPGQGYQIKTNEPAILHYLSNDDSYRLSSLDVTENNLSHFSKVKATDNNMSVIIEDASWDILPSQGSEIAAYDKLGNLIGSAVYSSPVSVITLWGDDPTTSVKDGLEIFEEVSFKIWTSDDIYSFSVSKWNEGSSSYNIDEINIVSSIETNTITNQNVLSRVLIKVVNLLGQEVNLENDNFRGTVLFNLYDDGSLEKFIK